MQSFGLKVEQLVPGVICVGLSGELDLNRAYTFDEEMRAVEALRPDTIVIDLRRVTFVDSAGLARIVAARRRAQRSGSRLVVVRSCAAVQRLFALTAMDHHLEMVSSPEAVLAAG